MRSVSVRLADLERVTIPIGFEGENEYTHVNIDCKKVFDEDNSFVPTLALVSPDGEAYPGIVVRDGDIVTWIVSASDLTKRGSGELQLAFTKDNVVGKTYVAHTRVERSITPSGEVPTVIENFIIEAGQIVNEIPQAIEEALDDAMDAVTAEAETLQPGSSATASFNAETKVLTIGVPAGEKGDSGSPGRNGKDGEDGYSPSASVSKSGKVATISITDKDGTTTATVSDGEDGRDGTDGTDGTDGVDGFSPIATVTKSGDTATISITDKNGTTTATISDGTAADIIDDEAGLGDTDKTFSADKLTTMNSELLNEIQAKPDIKPTDESDADLDITDTAGNVIARFADGHIQTKNFNSENADKVVQTTAGADIDLVDNDLNVILRLQNGHIRTKYFESRIRTRMEFGAHNGAEYYAPECTVPAYRIAGQQGWEWAWIAGIDFSTDGTMYVIHDDTVDRTTDGTGYLNQMSDTEINALNITQTGEGYNLSDFDPAELKIPTLEQVVQQCVRYDMKMVMRLALFPKNYDTAANIAKWDGLLEIINGYGIQPEYISCYISNGDQASLCRTLIGANVEISTFLGNAAVAQDFVDWFDERSIIGKRAAIISISNVDATAVKLLHSNGIRVYAYGYNPADSVASTLATLGVDIMQNGKVYKLNN